MRGVMGPFGSGKSSACVMELYKVATTQEPWKGVRRTRFACIRNTYPELKSTTIKTWKEWIPERVCPISFGTPITGHWRGPSPCRDGTRIDCEILFLALDREDDIAKITGIEFTAAWMNEAVEMPEAVLKALRGRVNRFPPQRWGGPTWTGVIMDTNPPDDDHWWYRLAEKERPPEHEFFRQPPALIHVNADRPKEPPELAPNPTAEGVRFYENGYNYWIRMCYGADLAWIKVYVLCQYGSITDGKPVYPEYKDWIHCAKEDIKPWGGVPMIVGLDFGLTPAAVFLQFTPKGKLHVIDEMTSKDMGIRRFATEGLIPKIKNEYSRFRLIFTGDPQGKERGQGDELTCYQILRECGIHAEPAAAQSPTKRLDTVKFYLNRMVDGEPAFQLSPRCDMLRRGFRGKYQYRRMRLSGERYTKQPDKNVHSHPQDALQYGAQLGPATDSLGGPSGPRTPIRVERSGYVYA